MATKKTMMKRKAKEMNISASTILGGMFLDKVWVKREEAPLARMVSRNRCTTQTVTPVMEREKYLMKVCTSLTTLRVSQYADTM